MWQRDEQRFRTDRGSTAYATADFCRRAQAVRVKVIDAVGLGRMTLTYPEILLMPRRAALAAQARVSYFPAMHTAPRKGCLRRSAGQL